MEDGSKTIPIIRSGWTIGSSAAENERDLFEVFIDTGSFESLSDVDNRRSLLVGRTGAGKSASLSQIESRQNRRALRIRPQDFAFQYLTNTNMVTQLKALDVDLSPFFRALWQHVIVVEILNYEYRIFNDVDKANAFDRIKTAPGATRARQTALDYLDEFGSDFWEPAHVRVKQITENFEGRILAGGSSARIGAMGNSVGLGGQGEISVNDSVREEREIRDVYQNVVARSLAPKMSEVTKIIDEVVLANDRNALFVLIDDLDLEWSDEQIRIDLIRSLFDAVLELQRRVRNLKILVALRSNIFGQLGYEQSRFHQVEKILDSTQVLDWSRYELQVMIETRLERLSRSKNLPTYLQLSQILPADADGVGNAFDWILDRTLLRPRDVIVWMNEVLRRSAGRTGVTWDDLVSIEKTVSVNRLDSLRDEWQDPYWGIEKVFDCFRQHRSHMTVSEYMEIVNKDIAPLIVDDNFNGREWLNTCIQGLVSEPDPSSEYWFKDYDELTGILWKTGFLGISDGKQRVSSYSVNSDAKWDAKSMISEDSIVEIHRMVRAALEVYDV